MSCDIDLDNIDVREYEDADVNLQDELPEEVKECEKSVREDNPDMDRSTAIAICRDQLNMSLDMSAVQLAGDIVTEPIERVEEGENTVRYKNLKLLSPGIWRDSASQTAVWYSPEGLKNLEVAPPEDEAPDDAEFTNAVNIMHDDENDVAKAGYIDPDSFHASEDGAFADIVIKTDNSAGEFADDNLQKTLETQGAKGFGGPSIELPADGHDVKFNVERGIQELESGVIAGVGFVSNPASKPVSFARQTANRGVALSSGEQNPKVLRKKGTGMDSETKAKVLAQIDEDFALQGAMDAIQDDAQAIADELDVGVDEVLEVLDPLLDVTDEEEDVENADDEDEEDEEEEEDMDMQEGAIDSLEEQIDDLWGKIEELEAMMMGEEELSEEIENAKADLADAETVAELEEAKEELDKRLSELEEEPENPKTLAESENGESEIEGTVTPASTRNRIDGSIRR